MCFLVGNASGILIDLAVCGSEKNVFIIFGKWHIVMEKKRGRESSSSKEDRNQGVPPRTAYSPVNVYRKLGKIIAGYLLWSGE